MIIFYVKFSVFQSHLKLYFAWINHIFQVAKWDSNFSISIFSEITKIFWTKRTFTHFWLYPHVLIEHLAQLHELLSNWKLWKNWVHNREKSMRSWPWIFSSNICLRIPEPTDLNVHLVRRWFQTGKLHNFRHQKYRQKAEYWRICALMCSGIDKGQFVKISFDENLEMIYAPYLSKEIL